jgi:hypothetical protein
VGGFKGWKHGKAARAKEFLQSINGLDRSHAEVEHALEPNEARRSAIAVDIRVYSEERQASKSDALPWVDGRELVGRDRKQPLDLRGFGKPMLADPRWGPA